MLSLKANFIAEKLAPFKRKFYDYLSKHKKFNIGKIDPNISLQTEDEVYAACQGYDALVDYTKRYPHGAHLHEALARIHALEDNDLPVAQTPATLEYIEQILAYKAQYPQSHNDTKLLAVLERILLAQPSLFSAEICRKIKRLWPNSKLAKLVDLHLDDIAFAQCHRKEDWDKYLKDFPQGRHRQEAIVCIDKSAERDMLQELFDCKAVQDLEHFISKYPEGQYSEYAKARLELLTYQNAVNCGDYDDYQMRYPKGKYANYARQWQALAGFKHSLKRGALNAYQNNHGGGKYAELAGDILKRRRRKAVIYPIASLLFMGILLSCYNSGRNTYPEYQYSTAPKESTPYADSEDTTTIDSAADDGTYAANSAASDPSNDAESQYADNSLETGSKPYASYFGRAHTGSNYFDFNTSGGNDYVVIIRSSDDGSYINHTYIQGGETARLYVPDGTYMVYFYSGVGWDPDKPVGNCYGGFVKDANMQKDGPVEIYSAYMEYTLYPVRNGNLTLQHADEGEAI